MVQAIFSFLCSILISLGGSVTADNIGQDFATIYSNQDPSVQRKMDMYLFDPGGQLIRDITLEGTKLTTEMLYDVQSGNVSNEIINDSIGWNAFQNFIITEQDHVMSSSYSLAYSSFSLSNGSSVTFYVEEINSPSGKYVVRIKVTDKSGNVTLDGSPWEQYFGYYDNDLDLVTDSVNKSYVDENGQAHIFWRGIEKEHFSLTAYTGTLNPEIPPELLPTVIGDGTIGQITDATIAGTEIGHLPIAADGSITLPDGTKVYPNSDGTYNIDNRVYSPTYNIGAYDDSALLGLLQQLLTRIDELENKLEFEEDTTDEKLEEKLDDAAEAAQSYSGSLSEFMLDSAITKVFPFCLPFDFVRGVKLFNASPQTPIFTYHIQIPSVGTFQGTEIEIKIDFSHFETLASISRWVSTVGFAFSLIFVSTKIVKGAGA